MPSGNYHVVDWDRGAPAPSQDTLLLRELQHRVANEVCASIAAMRIARTGGLSSGRMAMIDRAIERLEGFGQVHTILSRDPEREFDLDADLHSLCRGLVAGRDGLDHANIRLVASREPVPGPVARRLLLIGSELILNGIRHALTNRVGRLDITSRVFGGSAELEVSDDGPGLRGGSRTRGTGLGSGIVRGLVEAGSGRIECESGGSGTTFRVILPFGDPFPDDWPEDGDA